MKKLVTSDERWKKAVFWDLLLVAQVADFFQNSSARILRMHVPETVPRWWVMIRGTAVVARAHVVFSFSVIVTQVSKPCTNPHTHTDMGWRVQEVDCGHM